MKFSFHFALVAVVHAAPQVKIGSTILFGRDIIRLNQHFFGGIPYAEPPLGNLRLKPPVLKTQLGLTSFDASNFGPACLQPDLPMPLVLGDCLTINVIRPSNISPDIELPLVRSGLRSYTCNGDNFDRNDCPNSSFGLCSHGGGFVAGSSTEYNGSYTVAHSVARGTPLIYVNFNYRLGPLGYPQGQEAAHQRALNLGLKGEIAALEWVQHNMPPLVAIFGESAGAIMNSILYLNSPLDKLVRGVILPSGSQASSMNFYLKRREGNWENFVAGVASCASTATSGQTFDCLRRADEMEILSGIMNAAKESPERFRFFPTINGPGGLYPSVPSRRLSPGKFARVPFMSGTTLDEEEIRQFITANYSPPLVPPEELDRAVNKLLELYPDIPALGSPFNTDNETFGLPSAFKRTVFPLSVFILVTTAVLATSSLKGGGEVLGYLYTNTDQILVPPFLGVAHFSEVPYVYGMPSDSSPSSHLLSKMMMDYWISFATSLDPNDGKGTQRPFWEQYTGGAGDSEHLIQFDGDDIKMISDTFREAQIDYINSIPLIFLH